MAKIKGRLNFKLPMQGKKIIQNTCAKYLILHQVSESHKLWNEAKKAASITTQKVKENPKDPVLREANKIAHCSCLTAKRCFYAWKAISNNFNEFVATFGRDDMFLEDILSVAKWQMTRLDAVNSLMGRPTYEDHQKFSDMLVNIDKRLKRIENNFDDGR